MPEQLKLDFEKAEKLSHWQDRIDLYSGLSDVDAWALHLREVKQRFCFGSAPAREVEYVEKRYSVFITNLITGGNDGRTI
jgi:hypothetical protein